VRPATVAPSALSALYSAAAAAAAVAMTPLLLSCDNSSGSGVGK